MDRSTEKLSQGKPGIVTVIGAAILDVLAGPVSPQVFATGSSPMQQITMTTGGDALNEAILLNRLGIPVDLISKVGADEAGDYLLQKLHREGLDTSHIIREEGLATGINVVLVDEAGERSFLTNPQGSLRKLGEADIMRYAGSTADIVSFASIFVSPLLDIPAMTRLFRCLKEERGVRILTADMTKAKHGETLSDLCGLLPYLDYLFPNREEIALLTGDDDPYRNAQRLVSCGVKHAVVKNGAHGAVLCSQDGCQEIPAWPETRVVDTTGAGDSFAAGFLYGLAHGLPDEDCARMACAAASCAIEQWGASTAIQSDKEILRRWKKMTKNREGDAGTGGASGMMERT